jgi:hypothetical protein
MQRLFEGSYDGDSLGFLASFTVINDIVTNTGLLGSDACLGGAALALGAPTVFCRYLAGPASSFFLLYLLS